MTWEFKKASNNLIFANNAETGDRVRFSRKNAKSEWEATGKGLTATSPEFLEFAPKKRTGRPKKFEDGKGFFIRVPEELHAKLKGCDKDNLRQTMQKFVDMDGMRLVIDFDFGGWEAMTPEEVDKLEKDWGETAWNESGPYICTSPKDAIALIADQIECETQSNLPNIDKIDRLNDLLKEFVKLI